MQLGQVFPVKLRIDARLCQNCRVSGDQVMLCPEHAGQAWPDHHYVTAADGRMVLAHA